MRDEELEPGQVTEVDGWAVANRDGELIAVSRRCRHQLADLSDGHVGADGCLVCPWHSARYDLDSGAMEAGPQGVLFYRGHIPGYDALVKRTYARFLPLQRRRARRDAGTIVVEP